MGSGFLKNTGAYLGIALIVIGVFYLMVSNQSASEIAITEVISLAQDDRIENIDSASRLNFQTIHLTNPAEIKSLVKKKLI